MRNKLFEEFKKDFENSISKDLEVNNSISVVFRFIKNVDLKSLDSAEKKEILDFFKKVELVLGLDLFREDDLIPQDILKLAELRNKKRLEKNFLEADKLRNEILKKGFVIKDLEKSYKVQKV